MYEKSGELVAQFKTTVLLMPNGSDRRGHSNMFILRLAMCQAAYQPLLLLAL